MSKFFDISIGNFRFTLSRVAGMPLFEHKSGASDKYGNSR
ncbi:hypothetical protein BRAS3843_810003 [Bradyrhizobium sp. STM 3843]|nr:hypothetical protein BRAS3843_810003 [Bradyrhizobium sp. STM 3843]